MEITPNINLSKDFGILNEPSSLISRSNVIAVRHAYSRANQFSENEQDKIKLENPGISKSELRKKKLHYHMNIEKYPFLIDAEILPETIPLIEKQTQFISELDL
jgi:hypothetical protein